MGYGSGAETVGDAVGSGEAAGVSGAGVGDGVGLREGVGDFTDEGVADGVAVGTGVDGVVGIEDGLAGGGAVGDGTRRWDWVALVERPVPAAAKPKGSAWQTASPGRPQPRSSWARDGGAGERPDQRCRVARH
jgi:hypothetical protein